MALWIFIGLVNLTLIGYVLWLERRPRPRRGVTRAALALCGLLVGYWVLGIVSGASAIWRTRHTADPAKRAALRAEGISEGVNEIAFGTVCFLVPAITSLILLRKLPKRPPEA
jgi:hypothetical protein